MSTDRELLENAAKAAGVCLHPAEQLSHSYGNWGCDTTCMLCKKDPANARWDPLTNDGDALRLAVKLGIVIDVGSVATHAYKDGPGVVEIHGSDPYATTRRAIVRAAAAIGAAKCDTLIRRLSDEADLCRNDGATDIAGLLDEVQDALEQQAAQIKALRADAERLRADLISCRGSVGVEHHHYERLSMVHGKTPHGECYWTEAQRLAGLLDRIDSLAAIDAALHQEQPT